MHKKSIRLDTFLEPYTHLCASEKSSAQFYTYEWFFASQLKSCTIQTCTIPRNLEQTLAILDNFHISLRSDTTKYNLDTTQLKIMQTCAILHNPTQVDATSLRSTPGIMYSREHIHIKPRSSFKFPKKPISCTPIMHKRMQSGTNFDDCI